MEIGDTLSYLGMVLKLKEGYTEDETLLIRGGM